jgi:hypothetical protein
MIKNMNFPPEFKKHLATPNIKGAFVSNINPVHPRDCKNCGGVGTIMLFLATGGPFINVPSGIAHWADGRWWKGKNFEEMCPDCKGNGIDPKYVEQPVSMRTDRLTNPLKVVNSEVEVGDYTDV